MSPMSNLPNPGQTVRVECIQAADLTVTEAARWLGCSRPPLTHILNGRAATLDRLRHGAYRLTLESESYRSPRPMPEPRNPTVATGGKTTK